MRSYIEKNIQDHSQISRCLVVEDDASQLDLIRRQLSRLEPGIQIDLAGDYEEGLKSLKTNRYDFVLCDVMLPNNQSGVDLWRKVSRAGNFTPFVMTSGLRKEEFSEKFRFGEQAPEFLSKPFKLMDLQTKVDSVLMDIAIDPIELNFKSLSMLLLIGAGLFLILFLQILKSSESRSALNSFEKSIHSKISLQVSNTPIFQALRSEEAKVALVSLLKDDIMPAVRGLPIVSK